MKRADIIWLILFPIVFTSSLTGWSRDGHKRINYTASKQLSGSLGKFLRKNSSALKYYGAVPDFLKGMDESEGHHHFIDSDFYDEYPFNNIPKDYNFFLKKYGKETVGKMGDAPWEIDRVSSRVIFLLKNNRFDEAIYYMGVLGHYIADIHQPLHVILNYNGKLTGNDGVHFRWEVSLLEDYVKRLIPVGEIENIENPISFAFDIIRESYKSHSLIFQADTKARSILTITQREKLNSYDALDFEKPYLDILYNETEDLINDRLGKSIMRIASIWQYCWIKAGKPILP